MLIKKTPVTSIDYDAMIKECLTTDDRFYWGCLDAGGTLFRIRDFKRIKIPAGVMRRLKLRKQIVMGPMDMHFRWIIRTAVKL